MSNPFIYAELHSANAPAARDFYRALFTWKMEDHAHPAGTYTEINPGEGSPAGLVQDGQDQAASHWLPYVKVGDLLASTAQAKFLGATPLKENVEVPAQGRYSVLRDPTGALFGLWQPTVG